MTKTRVYRYPVVLSRVVQSFNVDFISLRRELTRRLGGPRLSRSIRSRILGMIGISRKRSSEVRGSTEGLERLRLLKYQEDISDRPRGILLTAADG